MNKIMEKNPNYFSALAASQKSGETSYFVEVAVETEGATGHTGLGLIKVDNKVHHERWGFYPGQMVGVGATDTPGRIHDHVKDGHKFEGRTVFRVTQTQY